MTRVRRTTVSRSELPRTLGWEHVRAMTSRSLKVARVIAGAGLAVVLGVSVAAAAAAPTPTLPADARLAPVREPLEKLLARAAGEGLPADLIAGKVREGLAKGVAPEAIRA